MFGFKPLLGLESMASIRPQLLVSHANHSTTETSMYVCIDVCMYICMYVCMYVCHLHFMHYTVTNFAVRGFFSR